MDDLVYFCVEQIALHGEEGTKLGHLWEIASKFSSRKGSQENVPVEIDPSLKTKLWKHLLRRKEIIVRVNGQLHYSEAAYASQSDKKEPKSKLKSSSLPDLTQLVKDFGEEIYLLTPEEKHWLVLTGFPKNDNPVPNLHFKLLSCICKAGPDGIAQPDAAKKTKQDPRSFPARTKVLIGLGLIRKTPTLANGNNTFLLTHTRYDPKNERIQQKSIPLVSAPLSSVEDSAVLVTSDADTSSQTPQPRPIIPIQRKTFSRDQPISYQIKQVLNAVSTDRKGLYYRLMADCYTTPIDTFLEKAAISTPRPPPPIKAPVAKKAVATPVTRIPVTSTAAIKLSTKPKSITPGSDATVSSGIIQPASAIAGKASDKPQAVPSRDMTADAETVLASTTVGNEMEKGDSDLPKGNVIAPKANSKKRLRLPKELSTSPDPKRTKLSQPTQQQTTSNQPKETNLETSLILLSLIKQNEGVFELVPRLDLLYSSHVAKYHPTSKPYVDAKTLVSVLDDLEKRGELKQIMLSAQTSTGIKQYKSILILPGVDPVTNPKIIAIRKELERAAGSYRPILTTGTKGMSVPITSVEAARALCRSFPNAPIPTPQREALGVNESAVSGEPEVLEQSQNETREQSKLPSQSEQLRVQHGIQDEQSKEHTPEFYMPDIPPTPESPKSVQIIEKPPRPKKARKQTPGITDVIPAKRQRHSFHPEEDKKIIQGISLIRTYSGAEKFPWIILKDVIPDRKPSSLRRRYETLEDRMKYVIIRFLHVFETKYTEALSRGEVKPIQSGIAFDVEYYLNWYNDNGFEKEEEQLLLGQKPESTTVVRDNVILPNDLTDLSQFYDVIEVEEPKPSWQSEYFRKESSSARRRHDALYSEAFIFSAKEDPPPNPEDIKEERIQSLIKATILTPESMHDAVKTKEALQAWGPRVVAQSVEKLVDKKLITRIKGERGRMVPGRNFRITEKWHAIARNGTMDQSTFQEGQAFRDFLASAFRENKDVLVSPMTNDGSVLCMLNLVASQQVILRPAVDEFQIGMIAGYKGRAVDKELLDFGVVVAASDTFDPTARIAPSGKVPPREPGEPQAWISLKEQVLTNVLLQLKSMVRGNAHQRPSLPKEELVNIGGGIITRRECEVLLESLREDGLLKDEIPCVQTTGLVSG